MIQLKNHHLSLKTNQILPPDYNCQFQETEFPFPLKTKSPLTERGFCLLLNQNLTKNRKIPDRFNKR